MSETLVTGLAVSIGPTLLGIAAVVQSTRGRREAAAANRAVNHQGPDEASLIEKVNRIDQRTAGIIDEQRTIIADVGELHGSVAECATEIGMVRGQLTTHLAQHQADHEAAQAARRGDVPR